MELWQESTLSASISPEAQVSEDILTWLSKLKLMLGFTGHKALSSQQVNKSPKVSLMLTKFTMLPGPKPARILKPISNH